MYPAVFGIRLASEAHLWIGHVVVLAAGQVVDEFLGGGGRDIEQRPAMFCREHLEKMLGHPPAEQSIFRRLVGPEE